MKDLVVIKIIAVVVATATLPCRTFEIVSPATKPFHRHHRFQKHHDHGDASSLYSSSLTTRVTSTTWSTHLTNNKASSKLYYSPKSHDDSNGGTSLDKVRLNMIPSSPSSRKSHAAASASSTAQAVATDSMSIMSSVTNALSSSPTTATPKQPSPAQTMNEALFHMNKQLIDTVYNVICTIYPVTGTNRDYCRFFVLETVARVPYFAYLSVLHLRETLGQRTIGEDDMRDRMRTHYAEADNELHHLLIMEELGRTSVAPDATTTTNGATQPNDSSIQWVDRAVAHTMAFGYFWYVVLVYANNESAAYHLSELIEHHAYETYDSYLTTYASRLRTQPVPDIARRYYVEENPVWLDLCRTVQTHQETTKRKDRVQLNSLYDVFIQIRNDEGEHWKTLCNLVQYDNMQAVTEEHVHSTQPSTLNIDD